jgi:hypothetical protein
MEPEAIYRPNHGHFRVCWYGGQSQQLHFQKLTNNEWVDRDVRSLMEMPTRIKYLLEELMDYYDFSMIMEQERVYQLM